jgi:hypothetical protein
MEKLKSRHEYAGLVFAKQLPKVQDFCITNRMTFVTRNEDLSFIWLSSFMIQRTLMLYNMEARQKSHDLWFWFLLRLTQVFDK